MRAAALVVILTATVLAGCQDDGGGGGVIVTECDMEPVLCDRESYLADHHCVANDVRPRVYAPDGPSPHLDAAPWRHGDHWDYALAIDGQQLPDTRLVYYGDQDIVQGEAQHYMVGTPTREEALRHALFSTNPMVGRIHRALYSPHESGVHADMFHFPLCEGSQWQTRFFATDLTLTARQTPVDLPGGKTDPDGFRIEGTGRASSIVIEYSPMVRWFTLVDFQGRDTDVQMQLEDYGHGAKGAFHFLRGQEDEVIDLAFQTDDVPVERDAGSEGPYDTLGVWIDAARAKGTGRLEVHVRDPAGTSVACVGVAGSGVLGTTSCPAGPLMLEVPWQQGTWQVTIETALADDATRPSGEVRLVSIYDRGGRVA